MAVGMGVGMGILVRDKKKYLKCIAVLGNLSISTLIQHSKKYDWVVGVPSRQNLRPHWSFQAERWSTIFKQNKSYMNICILDGSSSYVRLKELGVYGCIGVSPFCDMKEAKMSLEVAQEIHEQELYDVYEFMKNTSFENKCIISSTVPDIAFATSKEGVNAILNRLEGGMKIQDHGVKGWLCGGREVGSGGYVHSLCTGMSSNDIFVIHKNTGATIEFLVDSQSGEPKFILPLRDESVAI